MAEVFIVTAKISILCVQCCIKQREGGTEIMMNVLHLQCDLNLQEGCEVTLALPAREHSLQKLQLTQPSHKDQPNNHIPLPSIFLLILQQQINMNFTFHIRLLCPCPVYFDSLQMIHYGNVGNRLFSAEERR